jgi:hypothetical protein
MDLRFYSNFGEIFKDYSNNDMKAVNGLSSTTLEKNVKSTDRGVYFPLYDSTISLPPNDIVPTFSFPSSFTLGFWIFSEDLTFLCIYSELGSNTWYLQRYSVESKLKFYYSNSGGNPLDLETSPTTFPHRKKKSGKWLFIGLIIEESIKVFINKALLIDVSITGSFDASQVKRFHFGYKISQSSFVGFVWSLAMFSSVADLSYFISDSSSNCLVGTCTGCSFAVVAGNSVGCISEIITWNTNAFGIDCNDCQEGCSSQVCLSCSECFAKSCEVVDSSVVCVCPQYAYATSAKCICIDSYYLDGNVCKPCLPECEKCSNGLICSKCKALNSIPTSGGCRCADGYFNVSSLLESDSCIPCGAKCLVCSSASVCLKCKVSGAVPELDCECNQGYYSTNQRCKPCHPECKECTSYGPCISCISTNSEPDSLGCKCIPGYGGPLVLSAVDSCVKCHEDCLECNQLETCLTCKEPLKVPVTIGCKCMGGYHQAEQCEKCPDDCESCNKTHCLTCFDSLAKPFENMCICPDGTFNTKSSSLSCKSCRFDCETCPDFKTCIKCAAEGAIKQEIGCACLDGFYVEGTKCVECLNWDSKSKSCIFCKENQYFFNEKCENCPDLCTSCSEKECFSCVENAVVAQGRCYCSSEYEGSVSCVLRSFSASIKFEDDMNILIWFSLDLSTPLKVDNLRVDIKEISNDFELIEMNLRSYKLKMTYNDEVSSTTTGTLTISKMIRSIYNNSLIDNEFSFEVTPSQSYKKSLSQNSTFSSIGSNTFYAGASVTLFISILSFNYVSFWNFLNSIQFIVYLRLVDVALPARFNSLVTALRKVTRIFSMFDYFLDESDLQKLPPRLYEFGFRSYLIFFNVGHWITILIFLLGTNFLVFLYFLVLGRRCRIGFIQKIMLKMKQKFKYNSYIRFLIQSYLDIGIASVIGLQYIKVSSPVEIVSYSICVVLSLSVLLVPILGLFLMNSHKEEIAQGSEEINEKYGSLFYEVSNDKSLLASFYYFFFFSRRLAFMLIIFSFASFPIFQVLFVLILNMSVSFK